MTRVVVTAAWRNHIGRRDLVTGREGVRAVVGDFEPSVVELLLTLEDASVLVRRTIVVVGPWVDHVVVLIVVGLRVEMVLESPVLWVWSIIVSMTRRRLAAVATEERNMMIGGMWILTVGVVSAHPVVS